MALGLDPAGSAILPAKVTSPPRTGAFRVDIGGDQGAVVLALQGEADLATAPLLSQALAQVSAAGSSSRVVLDATRLAFIDAACLGVIANARKLLGYQGRDLRVRAPAPLFRRVLTIVEMEDLIERANEPATLVTNSRAREPGRLSADLTWNAASGPVSPPVAGR